ncbi:hypothetical protein TELCIR_06133 [Teladorsagia circumcincta]|uniref:Uncharacterized protein n=1 Tax=Teladorsagia circumcincta TaxID=45464 RepID=A0A2G9UP18_TELCI|nr:hypothetical protein TELCIR_06133 [Teladorsagia circumcincta]
MIRLKLFIRSCYDWNKLNRAMRMSKKWRMKRRVQKDLKSIRAVLWLQMMILARKTMITAQTTSITVRDMEISAQTIIWMVKNIRNLLISCC